MKIVIAPDSFKGSLSSMAAATAIEKGIRRVIPGAKCKKIPMADGGEGTVDALLNAMGGKRVTKKITGPAGEPVRASYGFLTDGKTAVIEMAAASGLHLVDGKTRNPLKTTSFGTGELIIAAIEKGAKRIILGLGGSATVDAGMGMAQALGAKFLDENGRHIRQPGCGKLLRKITDIDISDIHPAIKRTRITIASDVKNALFGKQGAAYVYGSQKGATPKMLKVLDENLRHFSKVVKKNLGKDVKDILGAGAAGGLGYGLAVFTQAKIQSGIEVIARSTELKEHIAGADLVITGEGRIDSQTAFGKTPTGIAKIAGRFRVPVVAIGGSLADDSHLVFAHGINALEASVTDTVLLDNILVNPSFYLTQAAERVIRQVMLGRMIEKRGKNRK